MPFPRAGVAQLADAQDLGFCVSRVSKLLTDAQHSTRFIIAAKGRILKLALFCSLLLIVGPRISESPAMAQDKPDAPETETIRRAFP
jgi:hypothetical protein